MHHAGIFYNNNWKWSSTTLEEATRTHSHTCTHPHTHTGGHIEGTVPKDWRHKEINTH